MKPPKPPKPIVIKSFALLAQALAAGKPSLGKPPLAAIGKAGNTTVSFTIADVTLQPTISAPDLASSTISPVDQPPKQPAIAAQPLTASVGMDKPPRFTSR